MDRAKLPRWLSASIAKHFDARRQGLAMFLEGSEKQITTQSNFIIRLNGPTIREPSKDYFVVDVDINILVITVKDQNDAYLEARNTGIVSEGFTNTISVYKYGDDDAFVGCLALKPRGVIITPFGQMEKVNVFHATVEAEYQMVLT